MVALILESLFFSADLVWFVEVLLARMLKEAVTDFLPMGGL